MTKECFDVQVTRLKLRFGEKAFDPEFIRLISREMFELSNDQFISIIDTMIGSRKHTDPPTIVHFREMRSQTEKQELSKLTHWVAQAFNKDLPLKDVLQKHYAGCETLAEAIEIEKIKIKVQQINDGGDAS
jgi:hypothetical protein